MSQAFVNSADYFETPAFVNERFRGVKFYCVARIAPIEIATNDGEQTIITSGARDVDLLRGISI